MFRFLNPRIISTIPFYLDLQFENVLVTPVINVMLPPSSFVRDLEDSLSGSLPEPKTISEQLVDVKEMLRMVPHPASLEVTTDLGGQMHLHQTLNTILASTEAIWEQFEVCSIPVLFPWSFTHCFDTESLSLIDED